MFKKWKAARKLKKFRKKHPQKNIDPITGNVIIDECHIVCFVNDAYPIEHLLLGVADAVSEWMYTYSSDRKSLKWHDRKSNPVIFKVDSDYEMKRLLESPSVPGMKTVSFFAGEPIAICIGPMWNSVLNEYNIPYEMIQYE